MPLTGCPSGGNVQSTISLCQATGNVQSPYTVVTVNASDLSSYLNGTNIIPVPLAGCPNTQFAGTVNAGTISICVPSGIASAAYNQMTVPTALLDGYVNGVNIIPMPASGCPVASVTNFSGPGTTGGNSSSNTVPAAFNTTSSGLPATDTVAGRSNSVPQTGGVLGSARAVSPLPPSTGSGGFGASDEGPVGAVALGLGFIILAGTVTTARLLVRQR